MDVLAGSNGGCDRIEIAGADEALMLHAAVFFFRHFEFAPLQLGISGHPAAS